MIPASNPKSITAETLQEVIAEVARTHPNAAVFKEGACSEFALALYQVLKSHKVSARIQIGLRTETDMTEDDSLPLTCFSHAIVQGLETTWDIDGPEAGSRWEVAWMGSSECNTLSHFKWRSISAAQSNTKALADIIAKLAGPELNSELVAEMVARFEEVLGKCPEHKTNVGQSIVSQP